MEKNNYNRQTIFIFQEKEKAKIKIKWIKEHDRNQKLFKIKLFNLNLNLPDITDNLKKYLYQKQNTDLVLDYLIHPDLSQDLAKLCIKTGIPIISSGKKNIEGEKHFCPSVCCALPINPNLGIYGKYFGEPIINIKTIKNKIVQVEVTRGAPCGSTWKAVDKIIGKNINEAAIIFGLNIQYTCKAKNSNLDPTNYNNPIHLSAKIHEIALEKAINNSIRL